MGTSCTSPNPDPLRNTLKSLKNFSYPTLETDFKNLAAAAPGGMVTMAFFE
jgi:hypothetical protein